MPRLAAFPDRDRSDRQRSGGIEPPEAEERVSQQADEDGRRHVGTELVLSPLASGRDRTERVGEAALGDAEKRSLMRCPA